MVILRSQKTSLRNKTERNRRKIDLLEEER